MGFAVVAHEVLRQAHTAPKDSIPAAPSLNHQTNEVRGRWIELRWDCLVKISTVWWNLQSDAERKSQMLDPNYDGR